MMVCCRSSKLPSKALSLAADATFFCLHAEPCCCLVQSVGLDRAWTSILLRLLSPTHAQHDIVTSSLPLGHGNGRCPSIMHSPIDDRLDRSFGTLVVQLDYVTKHDQWQ